MLFSIKTKILTALSLVPLVCGPVHAGKVEIAPVSITVTAPKAASSVTIRNAGTRPATFQSRIFQWKQPQFRDSLFRTRKVVVSPPVIKLNPGKTGVIRIVRLDKKAVAKEESYRLIIDELPKPPKPGRSTVSMLVRHSLPVFFSADAASPSKLSWKAIQKNNTLRLIAHNRGPRRVRLSGLRVKNQNGNLVNFGAGLNGYVLGGSQNAFEAKTNRRLWGQSLNIIAATATGRVLAKVTVEK